MIESKNLEDFVQQQIVSAVDQFVTTATSDDAWITDLEQRIVKHVQDRITARFSNIETVPDLVQTVRTSVKDLMTNGHVPGISQYVDTTIIAQAIDQAVEREIQSTIDALMLDPAWLGKIENLINQSYMRRVTEWISGADINSLLQTHIDSGIDRWQERLKKDFSTRGISDLAAETELIVNEGCVTVNKQLCAQSMEVQDAVITGNLEANTLVLKGQINTDNAAWNELSAKIARDTLDQITQDWTKDLVDEVLDEAKQRGIEFREVLIGGVPLIKDNTLNPTIRHSKLESLGTLKSLMVSGETSLADTVCVKPKRLGINTKDPEMALSIWDEEVSLIAGKLRNEQAYLGTARAQHLSLGVNRKSWLDIDVDGLVTVKNFRIDRHRISFATQVPGYSGTRGDIVFNSDPNDNQPFAWVCLGAFRWKPLTSAS